MESRKLKRYDSAPLPAGSSSSAAAKAGAAHIINLPRPHLPPAASANAPSSSSSPPTPPKPVISTTTTATSTPAAAYEKQLAHYYACMEADNQSLLNLYDTHTADIAALRVLAQERKYKEAVFTGMKAKVAAVDAFLKELLDLATDDGSGLRVRRDANAAAAAAKAGSGKSSAPSAAPTPSTVTMDDVRDAVQRQRQALEAARKSEGKYKDVIAALEREVAALKAAARAAAVSTAATAARPRTLRRTSAKAEDTCSAVAAEAEVEDCCLPGTAKELREAKRKVRELERQLATATRDATDAAAALTTLQQQRTVEEQVLRRREEEVAALRRLVDSKDQLIAAHDADGQRQRGSAADARYTRTNSAPAGAPQQQPQRAAPHHRCGGETSGDRLVVSHHYRLLGGQPLVDAQAFSPESFKDAFLRSVSTLLHVPYGYLASVEVRTHAEAVSVEFDARHSSRVTEDEVDFLLLSHDYPEVMSFVEKAKAELATRKPVDRNMLRIKELEVALAEKEDEADYLRRTMRQLEASLDRRDADREMMDTEMETALRETEATVKELYEALQMTQQEVEGLNKSLAMKASQLRVTERAKDAAVAAAAVQAEKAQTDAAALQAQVSAAQAAAAAAREEAVRQAQQQLAEEKPDLLMSTFAFDVALSGAAVQRTVGRLLEDAQHARVVQALLLCHAARSTAAVPVQAKRCTLTDKGATLQATVDLAFLASKANADAVKAELDKKLRECSCSSVVEYVRVCAEAARREATTIADAQRAVSEAEQRAAAAIAAVRAETQAAQTTQRAATDGQLRELHARLSSVLPGGSADAESLVARVDQLVTRLTAAEAASRRCEEQSQRATRRMTEAQQEREQLQQTLSELTARCTEVRVGKEQLAARLAAAEAQARLAQANAGESASVLLEVKRLEAALRAKAATADAERAQLVEAHQAAAALAAARLAEAEEALASKEAALAGLKSTLSKPASPPPAAGGGGGGSCEEAALREALRVAKQERTALARQVQEMDTDMNDLSNIQAAMQRELETAKQELRAKKHDFDLLVKQLIRMEEREKKWQAESQPLPSPVSPRRQDEEAAERDDVARESLVVLTNSNTTLQQCLRRLHRTMSALGMGVRLASASGPASTSGDLGAASGRGTAGGGSGGIAEDGTAAAAARRSGHRKSAFGVTVSRAAADHQRLSAQLADLLLPMLERLEATPLPSTTAAAAAPGTPLVRIVKHPVNGASFARTASAPVAVTDSARTSAAAAPASLGGTPKRSTGSDAVTSLGAAAVAGSASKTGIITVDAAPRLDFHRQGSSRTYMRCNTAASVTAAGGPVGGLAGLPPAGSSPMRGSGEAAAAKEPAPTQQQQQPPSRRTSGSSAGGGAAAAAGATSSNATPVTASLSVRRQPNASHTTTTTPKANPFRRSSTATTAASGALAAAAAGGTGGGHNAPRAPNGARRTPTATTVDSSSQTKRARPTLT